MTGCEIPIKYTDGKPDGNSYYEDSLTLHLFDETQTQGPIKWFGSVAFGELTVWVTQKDWRSEVSASDVRIERQKSDEQKCFLMTSPKEIAEAFNKYLYDLYR